VTRQEYIPEPLNRVNERIKYTNPYDAQRVARHRKFPLCGCELREHSWRSDGPLLTFKSVKIFGFDLNR